MKTKNKMLALLEIAVVLCSLFLVALPTVAADQTMQKASASTITTASEDDYVLGIYGNANEDDTIDMRDLTYEKLIFFGKKPETELADAKYDGKINPLDFIQIKLIIVGKEKELTYLDTFGEVATVHKPVKRIVVGFSDESQILRTLDAKDKIVGIDSYTQRESAYFPELSKLPLTGGPFKPDYETVLSLHPDVYMPYVRASLSPEQIAVKKEYEEKLPGVHIIWLVRHYTPEPTSLIVDMIKLGYILDKREEAEEFIDWYKGYLDKIESRTEGLSEDKKQQVYVEWIRPYRCVSGFEPCDLAGGRNICADLTEGSTFQVDAEWVMEQNPDIIIKTAYIGKGGELAGYNTDDPSGMIAMREEIMNRPELANVAAVKTGRVYVIEIDFLTIGSSHLLGVAYSAKWFYPELFEDLDPEAIHQEYLDRFQRIDYDLDEHGVFVYPKEPV